MADLLRHSGLQEPIVSVRVTIQDLDIENDYWNVDLDALPVIGHTLVMASAPMFVHHVVEDVVHHIGGGEQRIVVGVRRKPRKP